MGTGRAAIVDVETTGISERDEIIQIAVLLFRFDRETGEFLGQEDFYEGNQEPSFEIDSEATAVHGLTREKLRGEVIDRSKVGSLLDAAEFLVAHNAEFDRYFISAMFPEIREKEWRCSMRSVNWIAAGSSNKQLQTILAAHKIVPTRAHSAYDDVACLYDLLAKKNKRTGRPYFAEILDSEPLAQPDESPRAGWKGDSGNGIYVDEWEKWMAAYFRGDARTRKRKWSSLSPEQQDHLREEYGVSEHDTLFS